MEDVLKLFDEDIEDKSYTYVNGNIMKINTKNVLDQYFTKQEVAEELFEKTKKIILKYENSLDEFTWLEPSAGDGGFYNLFPKEKRIGVDIAPNLPDLIESDYLNYILPKNKKVIVMGNPPFGHRGVIALDFINHSKDAEYVCFILPMFFESKGKGSIKYRVKGFNLIHSERLNNNSFYNPNSKKNVNVKCIYQIWSKNYKSEEKEFSWYNNKNKEPFSEILKVYTVSLAKKRECGKRWIYDERADFYISSTFHHNSKIVYTFDEVKYKSGIAVVFTTTDLELKNKIISLFEEIDWSKYGSLATNSCYHLGKSNIFQVLQDNLDLITIKNDNDIFFEKTFGNVIGLD
jgi:hypothetical protein